MRTVIRNFISLFRRFKVATWLNVLGLTVAFAAFIVIAIQVKYEVDFDCYHSTSSRVFRAEFPQKTFDDFAVIHPRGVVEAIIHSSPHIEEGTIYNPFNSSIYFSIMEEGDKKGFKEIVTTVHPSFTKVFDVEFVLGTQDALYDPEKVIIPESMAYRLFGDKDPLGQYLYPNEYIWTKNRQELVVGGVYKDFPGNTQLGNNIYTAMDPDYDIDNFGGSNFICYVLLDNPASVSLVEEAFNTTFDFSKTGYEKEGWTLRLTPLEEIYFEPQKRDERISKGGSFEASMLLLGIGFLVVIIAAINFTNFSTSLAPWRIKNINTQKVLGSADRTLRWGLVIEAVLISFTAWVLSVLLLWGFRHTEFIHFTAAGIDLQNNTALLIFSCILSLLVGFIAGIYPACYITSFPPALVLKGNFGLTPKGKYFRTILIGFQFVVSMILIIASSFVHLQRRFMQDFNVGFDKEQIAVVELNPALYTDKRETLVNNWKSHAGIEDVCFAIEKLGAKDSYGTSSFRYNDMHIQYYTIPVSPDFFSVMGIPIVEGRNFSPGDEKGEGLTIIFNKEVADRYDLPVGTHDFRFFHADVVGFCGSVKMTSLRKEDDNIAFMVGGYSHPLPIAYVRLKAGTDYLAAVDHIRKTVAGVDAGYPVEIEFYDKVFEQLYNKEETLNRMITFFSILAITLSIMGVFGLVLFETQYRRKEISIRKVMGAEIMDILIMFNKIYLHIILICFVLAAPVAYYSITKWLQNFTYKTPVYWWVFVLAFILVASITMFTVTFQNWRAATENPVNSLKAE